MDLDYSRLPASPVSLYAGQNVWHEGSRFADIKVLNSETCVLITDEEDVRGTLSADAQEIDWEDGDCWKRVKPKSYGAELQPKSCVPAETIVRPVCDEMQKESAKDARSSTQKLLCSLLERDAVSLELLLDQGTSADTCVDSFALWSAIGLTPEGQEDASTPLLVAAILLQWPEASLYCHHMSLLSLEALQGVRICVEKHANVNATYARAPVHDMKAGGH